MIRHQSLAVGLAVIAGAVFGAQAPAYAAGDSFARKALGPSWVVTSPTLSIAHEQLVGSNLALGYLKTAATNNAASAVAFVNGTALQYSAIALGNIGGGSNAFIKLQSQNGDGNFDHAAFYTGDNAGGDFFALSSEVSSPAIMDVSFCGTVATLKITAASGTQVYRYDYGTSFGAGAGLGTYGSGSLDNFVTFNGTCLPTSIATDARVLSHSTSDRDLSK